MGEISLPLTSSNFFYHLEHNINSCWRLMVMSKLSKSVSKKLAEYGYKIFKEFEEDKYDIIFAENMVVYVFRENTLGVSFQATAKADLAATNVMILNEIPEVMDIEIMDSFIYNTKHEVVQGDAAYELIEENIKQAAINEYVRKQIYKNMLEDVECYDC
jgi:hypothetical protein